MIHHIRKGAIAATAMAMCMLPLTACEEESYEYGTVETESETQMTELGEAENQPTEEALEAKVELEEQGLEAETLGIPRWDYQARSGDATTMILPAGSEAGVLQVTRTGAPQLRAGQTYEYQIHVSNISAHPVHGVTIRETVPGSFQIDQTTPQAQTEGQGQQQSQMNQQMQSQQPQNQMGQEQGVEAEGEQQNQQAQQDQMIREQAEQAEQAQREQDQTQQAQQDQQQEGEEQAASMQDQQQQQQAQQMSVHSWSLGTLMPGETQVITVSGVPQDQGAMTSCLVAEYQPSLCSVLEVVKPELQITREIVNEDGEPVKTAYACDPLYARYRITNTGTGTTQAIRVYEDMPDFLGIEGGGDVEFDVEPLSAGESVDRQVALIPGGEGNYNGRAIATTGELEVRSSQATVKLVHPQLQMSISGPSEEYLNRPVRYDVTVTNTSDVAALDTIVVAQEADLMQNISYSGEGIDRDGDELHIGQLDPGQSRTISMNFTGAEPGELQAQFVARAYCAEDATQTIRTNLVGIPAIVLEVVDLNDPVQIGENAIYEVTVKNQGSAEDMNVKLSAELPQQLSFVKGEGDTEVTGEGNKVTFAPITELSPGEVMTWRIEAQANTAGKVRFQLQMQSDAQTKQVIEMEPTTLY